MPITLFKTKTRHFIQKHFYINRWNIGILKTPIANCLTNEINHQDVHWFPPLKGHQFIADPFAVFHDSNLFLFYEFLDYRNKIGKIHFAKLNPYDYSLQETGEALSSTKHLSYPYVFKESGCFYMIPESSKSKEISLYLATRFPNKWEKVHTLLNVGGIDNTILFYNNRWWLFFTLSDYKNQALQELHLAFSDDLMGKWQLHPKNPVKIDRASARPGGTPFVHQKSLFRPAQDCSKNYGGGITINKVLQLTETVFHEEAANRLSPILHSSFPDGLHTLSRCDGGAHGVIDGLQIRFTPFKFVSTWKRRWFRANQIFKGDTKL